MSGRQGFAPDSPSYSSENHNIQIVNKFPRKVGPVTNTLQGLRTERLAAACRTVWPEALIGVLILWLISNFLLKRYVILFISNSVSAFWTPHCYTRSLSQRIYIISIENFIFSLFSLTFSFYGRALLFMWNIWVCFENMDIKWENSII